MERVASGDLIQDLIIDGKDKVAQLQGAIQRMHEFERGFDDPKLVSFRDRVEMAYDKEVDNAYPARWIGKVTVTTLAGEVYTGRADEPKGDPGNTLTRDQLAAKVRRLAAFSGAATNDEIAEMLAEAWGISERVHVGGVFP